MPAACHYHAPVPMAPDAPVLTRLPRHPCCLPGVRSNPAAHEAALAAAAQHLPELYEAVQGEGLPWVAMAGAAAAAARALEKVMAAAPP